MRKSVFVTGGAGFIGSHTAKALYESGFQPVVIDNFSTGYRNFVKWGPVVNASISNTALISDAISTYKPVAVLHFAAYIEVGESVMDPRKYIQNNVMETLSFIHCLLDHNVNNIVFSSTAATYGIPNTPHINESHSQIPINPYGEGKLMIEKVLKAYSSSYDLNHVIFRYFNAAGSDPSCEVGESHQPETHLIPLVLDAIRGKRSHVSIFGNDYPTPDGTCIRDYVHVADLANAHVLACRYLLDKGASNAFNLGNGAGFSVLDVIQKCELVTKKKAPVIYEGRRVGDPAILVSDAKKASDILNWTPKYPALETIIEDAWRWRNR